MKQIYIKIDANGTVTRVDADGNSVNQVIGLQADIYEQIALNFVDANNAPFTAFEGATAFEIAFDSDFVTTSSVMMLTSDSAIDKTNLAAGQLIATIDTNTPDFIEKLKGKDKIAGHLEIRGLKVIDSVPRTVCRIQIDAVALGSINVDGQTPPGVITDYYTKAETDALISNLPNFANRPATTTIASDTEILIKKADGSVEQITWANFLRTIVCETFSAGFAGMADMLELSDAAGNVVWSFSGEHVQQPIADVTGTATGTDAAIINSLVTTVNSLTAILKAIGGCK